MIIGRKFDLSYFIVDIIRFIFNFKYQISISKGPRVRLAPFDNIQMKLRFRPNGDVASATIHNLIFEDQNDLGQKTSEVLIP